MNNRDIRRFNRWTSDPGFRGFCAQLAATAGVAVPPGMNPAHYVLRELNAVDPEYCARLAHSWLGEYEKHHGVPRPAPDDAHDWDAELPAAKVAAAWKALPEHSRLRQSARSEESEALAQIALARMAAAGVVPFPALPGMTPGEAHAAYLHYVGKHSKALASGDRALYDSLSARLGGAYGDGEGTRWAVDQVKQINRDDYVLHRIAEKTRAAEAEAAKHRPKPPEEPVYDKKFIPQGVIKPKEKQADGTRAEVARQIARQKAGWELPDKRRSEPLRMTIRDRDHLATALALAKHKGESLSRVYAALDPALHREIVGQLRDRGIEPALASSRSSGNSSSGRNWVPQQPSGSERNWVPAQTSNTSGGSYPTGGGGYAESGSGEAAPADSGGAQQ